MLVGISLGYALFNHAAFAGVTRDALLFLTLSGALGLVIGDGFYFAALGKLGPRRTLQVLTLAPAVSASAAWFWLGERLGARAIAGMIIVMASILAAALRERSARATAEPGRFSRSGFLIAVTATVCHGSAAVLIRKAYAVSPHLDTIAATTVRVSTAAIVICVAWILLGRIRQALGVLVNRPALVALAWGSLLGPVAGMVLYVASFKFAPAGIASMLSSLSPLFIIPMSAMIYKTRINWYAAVCMLGALAGVALIFWG